jgi:hypothetical protein
MEHGQYRTRRDRGKLMATAVQMAGQAGIIGRIRTGWSTHGAECNAGVLPAAMIIQVRRQTGHRGANR